MKKSISDSSASSQTYSSIENFSELQFDEEIVKFNDKMRMLTEENTANCTCKILCSIKIFISSASL